MKLRGLSFLFWKSFFFAGVLFCAVPLGEAQEDPDQAASVAQAQATLASLFGSKAVLPVPPQVNGTIALPSFDSKDLRVDEEWSREREASGSEEKS